MPITFCAKRFVRNVLCETFWAVFFWSHILNLGLPGLGGLGWAGLGTGPGLGWPMRRVHRAAGRLGWLGLGGLGWAGLGWAGLGWAGLGWAAVTVAAVGWAGLGWAGLGSAGLGWAGLGWAGLGWAGLGWAGSAWAGLGWAGLGSAGLGWAGPGWAGLGWAGLGWAGLGLGWLGGWAILKRKLVYSKIEIGFFENGKVCLHRKNKLPDDQQQQAISIYFFLEGLGFRVYRNC